MSAEICMNHFSILCATVVIVFTSLPWGLLLFATLKIRKEGDPPSFHRPRVAQFGGLREQRVSWRRRAD